MSTALSAAVTVSKLEIWVVAQEASKPLQHAGHGVAGAMSLLVAPSGVVNIASVGSTDDIASTVAPLPKMQSVISSFAKPNKKALLTL
jgi:hypothetical protein